jgi:hypothetical protein
MIRRPSRQRYERVGPMFEPPTSPSLEHRQQRNCFRGWRAERHALVVWVALP